MNRHPSEYYEFYNDIQDNELVFLFGTGVSSALTGKSYGWMKWIVDGIEGLTDRKCAEKLKGELEGDNSTENMVSVVGKVMDAAKKDGTYASWMYNSFEANRIHNAQLANTLRKLLDSQVVFATTNYDLLLEKATGLSAVSYENPDIAFSMLDKRLSTHVLHLHGIYDSVGGIDNIVADDMQYKSVIENLGAQFIQNILGTRTLVFVGCGKTTEDANISRFINFAKMHLKMDRAYYFLCKEPVEGLPQQIIQIQYGDDNNDLPIFMEEIAQIRLRKRIAENHIIGRNAYTEVISYTDSLLKYHFSQRTIPFCGREKELSKLRSFIEKEGSFSWWSVTGQAGAGKSRLAMELLYNLPTAWFGFFLNDGIQQRDIDSFKPFCNTLVIIDYIAGRERLAADVLYGLKKAFEATAYQLRVLLLERDNNKSAGSWYSKLAQRMNRADFERIMVAEYSENFLNLIDMERADVESFIAAVCMSKGITDKYASELYEAYGDRFERLRFRPLYLQLYVEAWIDNDCSIPQYESYTELFESLLAREQERWLNAVDGNQNVCNAFIRLMVRGNISGRLSVDEIPQLYKSDWNVIHDFIKSKSFNGKQRKEWQDTLINSFCHNIDREHAIISPQFPDIIKEFMFFYYTDEDFLPEMMKEIWQHSAAAFSVFIARCMMDFPEQVFFTDALNAYKASTTDYDVLTGRLGMLRDRLIQKGEDPQVYWDIIDNEHNFWSSIVIPEEKTKGNDILAATKVAGLYKVARHIGAWSLYDLTDMEEVVNEMLSVEGGQAADFFKKTFLQEHITALSTKGFLDEAQKNREKLDVMLANSGDEYDTLLKMKSYNDEMMSHILREDMRGAKKILLEMEAYCSYNQLNSVQALAHSCFNIDHFSMMLAQFKTLGTGYGIALKCEGLYPDDWTIRSRRIGCQSVQLQKQYFEKEIAIDDLRDKVLALEDELSSISFNGSESDEAADTTWGLLKTLKLNIASEEETKTIIAEAGAILNEHPCCTAVAASRIIAVRALHKKHLRNKITHREVEDLYKHVEANPDSESVRNEFFEMLEESVDAGRTEDYLNSDIIREAISDARYNPIMGSGIPNIDSWVNHISDEQPYARAHRKIGRNELCPCGSGKKFKKCCIEKGIYD